jgi:hypothetical protein
MTASYRMLKDSDLEPAAKAGTTVYRPKGHDYGLSDDDTRMTGVIHISVTLDPDGGYPLFTVPRADVVPLNR